MASEKTEVPVTEGPVDEPSPTSSARGQEPSKKKTLYERATSFFGDWYYVWEVFGILISGLAIVAICMVVFRFNKKEVPKWETKVPGRDEPFRLTINSLLSMLSVLGSTCAMIPVTKSLGQLKYLWFMEQDRKLADLEVFDSASRGKVGSALLIWKLRFKHLAALGGLASLLALAYGPFVQNLLTFNIQYLETNHDALLSYSWAYTGRGDSIEVTDGSLMYAVDEALQDVSVDWVVPALRCKTSKCEWEPYYTIAACSRCKDISHLLTRTCTPVVTSEDGSVERGGCSVALPNGLSLNSTGADKPHRVVMLMNTTMSPLVSNYSSPLAFVQSIEGYPPEDPASKPPKAFIITEDVPLFAHECAIIPCVQRQNLTIHPQEDAGRDNSVRSNDGVIPSLNITEQWDKYSTAESGGWVSIAFDNPTVNKNIKDQQRETFEGPYIDMAAYNALKKYLGELLNGYVYSDPTEANPQAYSASSGPAFNIYSHTINGNWTTAYCGGNGTTAKADGVVCGTNKVAAGLTNAFRLKTWQEQPQARLNGTTKEARQVCKAQWQYVSAPIAVWILGLVLFVGVVIKTRRAHIKAWRTSPLATLLLRLDPDSREHLKDWQNMGDAELKDVAKDLRLRLQMDESGPRFVRTAGPPS
ncbi:hypothetical protein LX32DRAFT_700682 [Colletotrichum zoysiae]|uniref:Uncharacterized protein n=1 Tax=Colletotrichum zoysiae TaxID=1216348 RepID=A0AAD9HUC4_9PEZI|nr:hypothetical protein LX32DRAFT_700682 [Colletotrichum zoysiae]